MNSLAELDTFIGKCQAVEETLSRTHGEFALFGLFERSDFLGNWDIVVAASWFGNDREAIEAVVEEMTSRLTKDEWLSVSRVVPLSPETDFVRTINRLITTKHKVKEFFALGVVYGVDINHAFVITSDPNPVGAREMQAAAA